MKNPQNILYAFSKKLQNNNNLKYPLFMIFTILGYIFFCTSKAWFPDLSNTTAFTPMDTIYTLDNRDFTLKNWSWSPTQSLMEVEIDVNNKNFDKIDKYLFSCRDKRYNPLPVEPVLEESNLLVIYIKDVPSDFSELSFRIKVDYGENTKEISDMVRFYTNRKDIPIVDKITPMTAKQYYIARLDRNIAAYEKDVAEKQTFISGINAKILKAQEDITVLRNNLPLQSADEAALSQKRIHAIEENITDFHSQIESAELDIFELEDKIKEAQEKMKIQEE